MTGITVRFEGTATVDEIPVEVDIDEHLFERQGGNLTEMSDADKAEFRQFVGTVEPNEAIGTALSIIDSAPAFDHIDVQAKLRVMADNNPQRAKRLAAETEKVASLYGVTGD